MKLREEIARAIDLYEEIFRLEKEENLDAGQQERLETLNQEFDELMW